MHTALRVQKPCSAEFSQFPICFIITKYKPHNHRLLPASRPFSMRVISCFTIAATALVIALTSCGIIDAYPRFVSRIPNAGAISGVQAIGHQRTSGGGALNAFGEAFKAQNTQWTAQLCQADSDGDGATNGEELGDPCCKWSISAPTQLGTQVSHPGVPNTWTSRQLNALKCQENFSPEAVGAAGNAATAAIAGTPTPAAVPADPQPQAQPRNAAGPSTATSISGSNSDDDDELPSTDDPNGLKETPSLLLPKSPTPATTPAAKTATPTPTPASGSSNRSFGFKLAAALTSLTASFAL